MKYVSLLSVSVFAFSLNLSAESPFTPVPGQGDFRFHTNFTDATAWNLEAGNFVTHPQAPTFRPSGGGTIDTSEDGTLTLEETLAPDESTLFGTARLDLTDPAILAETLSTSGDEPFAIYVRTRFVSDSALVVALGNDEAWAEEPVSGNVRIVSGYVRSSSALVSWGQKNDFNNPFDPLGAGVQVTDNDVPSYVTTGTTFDIALLFANGTVAIYLKEESATEWDSIGSPVTLNEGDDEGYVFASQYLGLYSPLDNAEVEITDLAISEAAPVADDSFLVWWDAQGFAPSTEPDPLADNGDGLPYLLRHAWGLGANDPFDPDRQPVVAIEEEGENTYLTITFFISDAADSVEPEVGLSPDLATWDWESAVAVGDPIAAGEGTLYTYRDTVATNAADRRFMKVRYHWTEED
ncbi:MAG: hypothetical protein JJT75_09610 [Opitutales bacterium]|nr:hypothetical protein [Opitutales bacterium]MCH8539868.1 hypothetical protein [Opitutales bacterium]